MRLNLSTNSGALADLEYVRMVAPQFGPRKKVANLCIRLRASGQINVLLQTVGWGSGHGLVVRVLDSRTLGSWVRSPHRAWFAFEA